MTPCQSFQLRMRQLGVLLIAGAAAFLLAQRKGDGNVIVEQFISGNEHRFLVVGHKVVAAARGEPAWVTGDGRSNIIELVDRQLNTDPRRGATEDAPLNTLAPHEGAEIVLELERHGLTAYSVPACGDKVLIQRNGNVAFDVTDDVHPSVAAVATLAARVVGLDIAGVDMVLEDASRSFAEQRGAVIEVNASPGLLAHLKPASGQPRPIGQAIIDHLFGPDQGQSGVGRIPVVGVTGHANTTYVARLIAWLLHNKGQKVGLACRDGFYLGARRVSAADSSDWDSGQNLLINRALDVAVFEHSSRQILAEGLAYDKCSVGVVTDLGGLESLAEFYIDDLDKLFNVVRTQVDVILPHGTAVLNADNPQVARLAPLCDGQVIFYGRNPDSQVMVEHRTLGERMVFLQGDLIVLAQGQEAVARITLDSLTPDANGLLDSVLAAVAAAWALGITPDLIGAGLRTFRLIPNKNIEP